MKKDWQSIAEGQAAIIDGLSFYFGLIREIAMHRKPEWKRAKIRKI